MLVYRSKAEILLNWRFLYSNSSISFADMTLDWVHIVVTASNQGLGFTSMAARLFLLMI